MRLVIVALAWTLGIIFAHHGLQASWPLLTIIASMAVLINLRNTRFFLWLNIALLAFTLGGWRYDVEPKTSDLSQYNESGGLTVIGWVTDAPDVTDTSMLLRVSVQSITQTGNTRPISGVVLVHAPRNTHVQYGDRVQATGALLTPSTYDTFDYGAYLARQGIHSLLDRATVEVIGQRQANVIQAMLIDLREQAKQFINRILPEPQAGLIIAVLTGDRRGLSQELNRAFSDVGTSHLIAISGFNMVIIAAVIRAFLRAIMPKRTWPPVLIACVVILTYGIFTGGAPPVMRAAFMSAMFFIAEGFKRRTFAPASIATTVMLISLHTPSALWDIGFQLSLCAVLGLVFLVRPLQQGLTSLLSHIFSPSTALSVARLLEESITVTLAAQIAVTPLLLLVFGQVSSAFLVVNVLVIPVHTYALLFGWLGVVFFWIPPLAHLLLWGAFALSTWTIEIIRLFADLPFAQLGVYISPQFVGIVYGIALGFAMAESLQSSWWLTLKGWMKQYRTISIMSICAITLIGIMGLMWASRPAGRLDVWFLDTGRGHVVLIQTPDGAQILINGGRTPSRLLNAIGEYLPIHDRQLDIVVITSPDAGANAALLDVFNRYQAGLVLTNGQPNLSALYGDILLAAEGANADSITAVTSGYHVQVGENVLLEILHPITPPSITDSLEDSALVLRVTYGEVSFLVMSNSSMAVQERLLDSGIDLYANVLQLPAHGGRNTLSAEFITAVTPSAIVLHAEAYRQDEPYAGTLALIPVDVPLYRTDTSGTQHFWTDGSRLFTSAR